MKKKIILFAILAISIILALVLIFVLVDRRRTAKSNENIKKISLVSRCTEYAWGVPRIRMTYI